MNIASRSVFVILCFTVVYSGTAIANYAISKNEMKMLPPYCKARFEITTNPQNAARWRSILGGDFMNVHHYCQGLNFMKRAYASIDVNSRRYDLQNAVNNFKYMINHLINSNFVLLPEIYLNLGKTYALEGDKKNAILSFDRSISIKRNYTLAYAAISDLYLDDGERKIAKSYLNRGLSISPSSRILRRRLNEINKK